MLGRLLDMRIGIVHVLMKMFMSDMPWVMLTFLWLISVVHVWRRRTVAVMAKMIMVVGPWNFLAWLLRLFGAKAMTSMMCVRRP